MIKPNFERLRKALMLEGEPDVVPKIELWIDQKIMSLYLGKEVKNILTDAKGVVEFMGKAGYDYAHIVPICKFTMAENAAQMSGGIISSMKDFENHPWPKREEIDFSPLEKAAKCLPDGMKIISGTLSGIFENSWLTMGFDTMCLSMIEDHKFVKAVFDKIGEITYYIFETVADIEGVGALWLSDDIAAKNATMVSPKHLREFLFPWYKKIGDLAKKKNKPFLYHSDGNLLGVLDDLVDCGFNALHPIESLSMDINTLKNSYGKKICLLGNIDVDLLTRGTQQEVEQLVKKRMEEVAPGGGYCCGSGNTVASYVSFENYKTMIESIEKYGVYLIKK